MPLFKKIFFSSIIFFVFLLILEGLLSLTPLILGFSQRGAYDQILKGGSTIICLGDSVTYGYGLEPEESWPKQLESSIQKKGAQVSVINRAVSGMDSTEALQREARIIQDIASKGSRPVVLLMIGHNDLAGQGWRQWKASPKEVSETSTVAPPRLWRIMRWATSQPEASSWSNPERESRLKSNIKKLGTKITDAGGQLYILTYLLPGTAKETNPRYAKDVDLSRALQGKGNDIMRTLSKEEENLRLIDVHASIDTPTKWNSVWFQDHIHPTAMSSGLIAQSVQRHLVSYGELPVSVLD